MRRHVAMIVMGMLVAAPMLADSSAPIIEPADLQGVHRPSPVLQRVLRALHRAHQGVRAAREHADHASGVALKGGRALRRIEDAEPAGRARPEVHQASTVSHPGHEGVDETSHRLGGVTDRVGDAAVVVDDEADRVAGRHRIEGRRGVVAPLGVDVTAIGR